MADQTINPCLKCYFDWKDFCNDEKRDKCIKSEMEGLEMMRSTGVVRKIDDLNRLVIPKEITRTHDFEDNQALEVYTDGENIVLRKYRPGCCFCGSCEDVVNYKGKNICRACLAELKGRVG